ncbi:MAG TPA: hypothetical protein VM118_04120, partial [Acidobacteriota bacterium]|nr:hypothetical protein [Acidobacteriota bacterium]
MELILNFYSIGALLPHANAASTIVTQEDIEAWRLLEPRLVSVESYPEHPLSADAAILLSCGALVFERDTLLALERAQAVIEQYPQAGSILSIEARYWSCPVRLNAHFYAYIRSISGARGAGPNDGASAMTDVQEAYITHLLSHPVHAGDVAGLFVHAILERSNRADEGISILANVLRKHTMQGMTRTKELDRQAAESAHGSALFGLMRPEFVAARYLLQHNISRGEKDRAIAFGRELANAVSQDGFYWGINTVLGDLYVESNTDGANAEAIDQYSVALDGYVTAIQHMAIDLSGSKQAIPARLQEWSAGVENLESRIEKAGGTAGIGRRALDEIRASIQLQDQSVVSDQENPEPARAEKRALLREFSTADKERRLGLLGRRKSVAIRLFHIAGHQDDGVERATLLSEALELINVREGWKSKTDNVADSSMRWRVDQLIAQISGSALAG